MSLGDPFSMESTALKHLPSLERSLHVTLPVPPLCTSSGSPPCPCATSTFSNLRDMARRGTEVTHSCRPRAPIPGRLAARDPLVQRLHPGALMHATILHTGCRGDEPRCEHLETPPDGGDTTRRARPRFGHGARGTAGSDTAGAREGCHTVGTAFGILQTCLAS